MKKSASTISKPALPKKSPAAGSGWGPRITPLRRDSLGDWSVEIELPAGEHRYRFIVDGEWRDDPAAQQTAQNPCGGFDAIMVVA